MPVEFHLVIQQFGQEPAPRSPPPVSESEHAALKNRKIQPRIPCAKPDQGRQAFRPNGTNAKRMIERNIRDGSGSVEVRATWRDRLDQQRAARSFWMAKAATFLVFACWSCDRPI